MNKQLTFLDWNQMKWEYKNSWMYEGGSNENKWPWYCADLDKDIEDFLRDHEIASARILDLGTCSGSQAIALANRGFDVVGTDVSETALGKAKLFSKGLPSSAKIQFLLDDILDTRLEPHQFDVIIDRGCFHLICIFAATQYIANVLKLLKDTGKIVLKTMSSKETRYVQYEQIDGKSFPMPYPFTPDVLRAAFESHFNDESRPPTGAISGSSVCSTSFI